MNLIFGRNASLQLRLIIAVILSLLLILGDKYTQGASTVRASLNTLVSPLFYLANLPHEAFVWGAESFTSREQLMAENQAMKESVLLQNSKLMQYNFLKLENTKLKALLGAVPKISNEKQIVQVLSINSNQYSHQVLINKGLLDNVVEGLPVIDDLGIVGQVTQVGSTTSRVLLITDSMHAIPVRILRNDVRSVVEGIGKINNLKLSHVPHSMDVRVGDILVSSGLGGVFPEGFPVATVSVVNRNESKPFAEVFVEPIAQIDRIRLLVLLWPAEQKEIEND